MPFYMVVTPNGLDNWESAHQIPLEHAAILLPQKILSITALLQFPMPVVSNSENTSLVSEILQTGQPHFDVTHLK